MLNFCVTVGENRHPCTSVFELIMKWARQARSSYVELIQWQKPSGCWYHWNWTLPLETVGRYLGVGEPGKELGILGRAPWKDHYNHLWVRERAEFVAHSGKGKYCLGWRLSSLSEWGGQSHGIYEVLESSLRWAFSVVAWLGLGKDRDANISDWWRQGFDIRFQRALKRIAIWCCLLKSWAFLNAFATFTFPDRNCLE